MALKKEVENSVPSLDKVIDKKLCLYVTVVNDGYGNLIADVFKANGSTAQFIQKGQGTARQEFRDMLGIEENSKDWIFVFVTEEQLTQIKDALNTIFVLKKMQGIGFVISLTTIVGVKVYQCLADIIKEN